MANYLKILLYIIVLSVVFLWFSTVIKSCGNKASLTNENGIENLNTATAENVDVSEELFEAGGDDLSFESENNQDEIQYDEIDKALSKNEADKKAAPKPAENKKEERFEDDDSFESAPVSKPNRPSKTASSSGNFLVITGSYLVRSNAENMVRDLNDLGYNSAEIVVFDNSQYNSVIASRYNNYQSAVDASSSLKRKGIDSYVHTKK